MTQALASLIDGKTIAARLRASLGEWVAALAPEARRPCLAVVQIGLDPASSVYVASKVRACAELGMRSESFHLPEATTEESLLEVIARLNADATIDGILVQMPLPRAIRAEAIIDAIAPHKDVDGFHPLNVGAVALGRRRAFAPCTPAGVMTLLASTRESLAGKHAVVIGRSLIVGRPLGAMLLAADATVTTCHSRTRNLTEHARQADVLIAAVGRPGLVTAEMVRPGAIVIDVGMNRLPNGRLTGDVDFEGARARAAWITPVPGGVGPMTIAKLLENTCRAYAWAEGIAEPRPA